MKQLPLHNPHFLKLQASFADWLMVLGYAESTLRYAPMHLREFLYFLETQDIDRIRQVKREQVQAFFSYLSERTSQRDGGKLSMAQE